MYIGCPVVLANEAWLKGGAEAAPVDVGNFCASGPWVGAFAGGIDARGGDPEWICGGRGCACAGVCVPYRGDRLAKGAYSVLGGGGIEYDLAGPLPVPVNWTFVLIAANGWRCRGFNGPQRKWYGWPLERLLRAEV